jgi:single stranded DNA-binding protein (ssb)
MSRLDDIIDLIQTTNEVYFITAPGRVRTAYILVDDIVELTLKTFLQEKALQQRIACQTDLETAGLVTSQNHRNSLRRYYEEEIDIDNLSKSLGRRTGGVPILQGHFASYPLLQHWSANNPSSRNTFDTVVNEVKTFFSPSSSGISHPASDLLDEALQRHTTHRPATGPLAITQAMINIVNLAGRAGSDPDVRYFESGKVKCRISLAVNRPVRDSPPDWFSLEIWGKTAEVASNYVRKGSLIGVQGSLAIDTWDDRKTGAPRSSPIIKVSRLHLLGGKRDNEQSTATTPYNGEEF